MPFADLVGHETAIRTLQGELRAGRVAHAYLFTGPEGIGKTALALEFARALLCERGSGQACGECPACAKVSQGTHPDLHRVAPEGLTPAGEERKTPQIQIDEVRELERALSRTSFAGGWRVGLVQEADTLTDPAADATLKLLEEPPGGSVVLLTSSAPYRLRPTLRSRCHEVRCRPQGVSRVSEELARAHGLPPERARMLALVSGGRMGRALALHQGEGLQERNAALDQLLQALQRGELEVPLSRAPRQVLREALEWYAAWWRDRLVLALGGEADWVLHQDRRAAMASEAERSRSSVETLLSRIEETYAVREAIERNANPRTALAALLGDA